ncbi:MAG: PEP-CTERM sorting domain-containing protein [Bryobacteraceae bacterium]
MKKAVLAIGSALAWLAAAGGSAFAGVANPSPAPEPSTILLVAGAGGALLVIRQLRKRR